MLCAPLACAEEPRRIADGWYSGPTAAAQRAVTDSMLGLATLPDPIALVGVDAFADAPGRQDIALTGERWARAVLALGPISVVVGHSGSAITNAAAQFYAEAGVPMIAPNSSVRATPDIEPWVLRLLPEDTVQGRVLAMHALDSLGAKRIAVVYVADQYGVGILDGVRAALLARGLPVVDEVELPRSIPCTEANADDPNRLAARAMLRRARPDIVILALPISPALCVISEVEAWQQSAWVLGSDALDASALDSWVRARMPAPRVKVVTSWMPRDDRVTRAFRAEFTRRTQRAPTDANALTYDAFALAADAVRETGGSPADVRKWLASLGNARAPWFGITGAIRSGGDLSGRLSLRTIR